MPPLQRLVTALPDVTGLRSFPAQLTAHQDPRFLESLGHHVTPDAPSGHAEGLARPAAPGHGPEPQVQRFAPPRSGPATAAPSSPSPDLPSAAVQRREDRAAVQRREDRAAVQRHEGGAAAQVGVDRAAVQRAADPVDDSVSAPFDDPAVMAAAPTSPAEPEPSWGPQGDSPEAPTAPSAGDGPATATGSGTSVPVAPVEPAPTVDPGGGAREAPLTGEVRAPTSVEPPAHPTALQRAGAPAPTPAAPAPGPVTRAFALATQASTPVAQRRRAAAEDPVRPITPGAGDPGPGSVPPVVQRAAALPGVAPPSRVAPVVGGDVPAAPSGALPEPASRSLASMPLDRGTTSPTPDPGGGRPTPAEEVADLVGGSEPAVQRSAAHPESGLARRSELPSTQRRDAEVPLPAPSVVAPGSATAAAPAPRLLWPVVEQPTPQVQLHPAAPVVSSGAAAIGLSSAPRLGPTAQPVRFPGGPAPTAPGHAAPTAQRQVASGGPPALESVTATWGPEGVVPTRGPEGVVPTRGPEGVVPTRAPEGVVPTRAPEGVVPTRGAVTGAPAQRAAVVPDMPARTGAATAPGWPPAVERWTAPAQPVQRLVTEGAPNLARPSEAPAPATPGPGSPTVRTAAQDDPSPGLLRAVQRSSAPVGVGERSTPAAPPTVTERPAAPPPAAFTELALSPPYAVQRQPADPAAPAVEGPASAGEPGGAPADATAAAPAAEGGAGAAGGAAPTAAQVDELARRLYEPLTARLRAELWLDRERAGRSMTR